MTEKGKLFERIGRKAAGLFKMAAGLPKLNVTKTVLFFRKERFFYASSKLISRGFLIVRVMPSVGSKQRPFKRI